MAQLAWCSQQTGIQESQPLVRHSLHIIPQHITTAALSQHRGWAVAALTIRHEEEEEEEEEEGGIELL